MQTLTTPRLLGLAVLTMAALALAGCGGPKRSVTTTVATTTPARVAAPVAGVATDTAGAGVAAGAAASAGADNRVADSGAAAPAEPGGRNYRRTTDKILAGTIGFGVLANGVAQTAAASGSAAGGAGLAGAGGQECRNPFGTQAASSGQLICSSQEERLQCQCDANGCQLVPTGIMACLPVGAVYR